MRLLTLSQRPQGSCPPSARCIAATLAPQPVDRGIDFVGQVIKPWCRYTRKRTVNEAISQVRKASALKLFEMANSYFGLLGQASSSHHDRAMLANELRSKGYSINFKLTKTYRIKEISNV